MNSAFALAIAAVSASAATYLFLNPKSGRSAPPDLSAFNNLLKDIDVKLADGRLSQEAADAERQKVLQVMLALGSSTPAPSAASSNTLSRVLKNPAALAAVAVAAVAAFVFVAAEEEASSLYTVGQSGHEQASSSSSAAADKDSAVSQLQAYARTVQGDKTPAPTPVAAAPVPAPTMMVPGSAGPIVMADAGKTMDAPMSKRPMDMAPGGMPTADGGKKPLADVDSMIKGLAARMEKDPNNADGWRMLGWSYLNTMHYQQAADAYARAVALKPDSIMFKAGYAEALVKANNDVVTPVAAAAFDAVLAAEPNNSRAVYYKGLAKEQAGDKKGALEYWTASLKAAAPEVEWAAEVKGRIEKLSAETGTPVAAQEPAKEPVKEETKPPEPVQAAEAAKAATPASIPQEEPKKTEALKEAPAQEAAAKAPEPATPVAPAAEAPAKAEGTSPQAAEPAKAAPDAPPAPAQAVAPAPAPATESAAPAPSK
jgi:tetratricopeptide (TPR) repeat protein